MSFFLIPSFLTEYILSQLTSSEAFLVSTSKRPFELMFLFLVTKSFAVKIFEP